MRILYHHRTRSKDGQHVHINELVHALRKLGHEVMVVAPPATEKAKFGDDAGAVGILKRCFPNFAYELLEFSYAFLAYWRLRRAALDFRPDVLYERYNLFLPSGVWLRKRFRLPMLLEVNAPVLEERSQYGGVSLRALARWSECYTWQGADLVLPVTAVLAERIRAAGVPIDRIVVIPNGINPEQFDDSLSTDEAKAKLGLGGRLVLGFTGFVRDWHGLDRVVDLIATRKEGPDLHLLVVGDGPERGSLEALARQRGIADRITFTGVVERVKVPHHIAAFDIALQPAVVPYASPLKLFEYLAMGRAIVAPRTANITEILNDGENAVLFDPTRPDGMVEAIDRIRGDAMLRERIAQGAKRTIVSKELTWDKNARRVVDLFERLMRTTPDRDSIREAV